MAEPAKVCNHPMPDGKTMTARDRLHDGTPATQLARVSRRLAAARHAVSTAAAPLLAVVFLPVAVLVSGSPAGAAPLSSQISSAQAEVAQISAAVNADNAKLNGLDEMYNEAQIRVQQDNQEVQAAQAKMQQAQQQVQQTVATLRKEAVNAYVTGGSVSVLGALISGGSDNLAVRSFYVDEASNQEQQTVAQLKIQQHELTQQQAIYQQALSADRANLAQVQADQRAAQQTIADENAQLAQVKGNLATLYAQWQQQQAAAAAAAAAQRQAAAAAAAAAAQQGGGSDPARPAPPPNHRAGVAVEAALAQQGKPYVWGGAGPDGFDCSGLVMYAWDQAGVSLAHGSIAQYYETTRISASQLEPGDLVFYSPPGDPPLGHVAMFIGNGEVVQALTTGTVVQVTSMYYVGNPVGYGRVS